MTNFDYDKEIPPTLAGIEMYCRKVKENAERANGLNRIKKALGQIWAVTNLAVRIMVLLIEKADRIEERLNDPNTDPAVFKKICKYMVKFLHEVGDPIDVKRAKGVRFWPEGGVGEIHLEEDKPEPEHTLYNDPAPERRTRGGMTSGLSLKSLTEGRNY